MVRNPESFVTQEGSVQRRGAGVVERRPVRPVSPETMRQFEALYDGMHIDESISHAQKYLDLVSATFTPEEMQAINQGFRGVLGKISVEASHHEEGLMGPINGLVGTSNRDAQVEQGKVLMQAALSVPFLQTKDFKFFDIHAKFSQQDMLLFLRLIGTPVSTKDLDVQVGGEKMPLRDTFRGQLVEQVFSLLENEVLEYAKEHGLTEEAEEANLEFLESQVQFLSALGTSLGLYHGIDGVVLLGGVPVSIDVTLREKEKASAHVVLSGQTVGSIQDENPASSRAVKNRKIMREDAKTTAKAIVGVFKDLYRSEFDRIISGNAPYSTGWRDGLPKHVFTKEGSERGR